MGALNTQIFRNHREYLLEAGRIAAVIDKRAEFQRLSICEDSSGYAFLAGDVPSESAKQELRRNLIQKGGEEWADRCLSIAVGVDPPPAGK